MDERHRARAAEPMSDAAVQAKTGKSWQAWFAILDRAGAQKMSHKEIAADLYKEQGCPGWWNQMVAVGYEQERGLREKYQKPSGYEISASKVVAVSVSSLYRAWEEKTARQRWLPHAGFTIRKATRNKSMRITWTDGKSNLDVNFYPKDGGKSQVAVQHGKLANAKQADRMKTYWAERLERLKGILEA
jgi:uncharacterized protein YndB with AHSA1/START domain